MTWSRKRGDRLPESLRFWSKVTKSEGCWEWVGARVASGYGSFRLANGRTGSAHRWAYEDASGPIPEALELDHLCGNRSCVNPAHLEPVTHHENVLRGRHNQNDGKTMCKYGHDLRGENLRMEPDGRRACRACGRRRQSEYRASKRSAL